MKYFIWLLSIALLLIIFILPNSDCQETNTTLLSINDSTTVEIVKIQPYSIIVVPDKLCGENAKRDRNGKCRQLV